MHFWSDYKANTLAGRDNEINVDIVVLKLAEWGRKHGHCFSSSVIDSSGNLFSL